MRILVTGATGNVGSHLVTELLADPAVTSVVGLARRLPDRPDPRVEWHVADTGRTELAPLLRGADAVVHLAFALQPAHDPALMHRTNVVGSERVFDAVAAAGVPVLVHASSVGTYAPGPGGGARITEEHPATGVPSSTYSRHKAACEAALDSLELAHPGLRVVRLRPGVILSGAAASAIARYFLGALVPQRVLRSALIPVVPDVPGLALQAVHSADAAHAFALAATSTDPAVRGAFNIAAEPVLTPEILASLLHARRVPVPRAVVRAVVDLTWRLHVQPTDPGWLDLGTAGLVMDTARARTVLGWQPERDAGAALLELLAGFTTGAGAATPVLRPRATGARRWAEVLHALVPGSGGTG